MASTIDQSASCRDGVRQVTRLGYPVCGQKNARNPCYKPSVVADRLDVAFAGGSLAYRLFLLGLFALLLANAWGCERKVAGGSVDGAEVYAVSCARCHGPAGVPVPAMMAQLGVKDLTDAARQAELSDADMRHQIVSGSENRFMPAFAGALTDGQIEAVIAHVRSLARPSGP